jgi:hypothetical protein
MEAMSENVEGLIICSRIHTQAASDSVESSAQTERYSVPANRFNQSRASEVKTKGSSESLTKPRADLSRSMYHGGTETETAVIGGGLLLELTGPPASLSMERTQGTSLDSVSARTAEATDEKFKGSTSSVIQLPPKQV